MHLVVKENFIEALNSNLPNDIKCFGECLFFLTYFKTETNHTKEQQYHNI